MRNSQSADHSFDLLRVHSAQNIDGKIAVRIRDKSAVMYAQILHFPIVFCE